MYVVLRARSKEGANLFLPEVKSICRRNHSQIGVCSWQLCVRPVSLLKLLWEKHGDGMVDGRRFKVNINREVNFPTPGIDFVLSLR